MNKDAKTLLKMIVLFTAGGTLANIFMNIFLIRTTDSILLILFTAISFAIATLASFLWGTHLLSKVNVTKIFRMGIFATWIYFLLLLVLQNFIRQLIIPLGIINGIGTGLYWCGFNLLLNRLVDDDNRGRFFGLQNVFSNLIGIFIPSVSGFVIVLFDDLTGYYILFACAVCMLFIAFMLSFKLKGFKSNQVLKPLKALRKKGNIYWDTNKWYSLSWGFGQNIYMQIFILLAFSITGSELRLGNYQTLMAVLSFFSALLITQRINPRNRENIHLIAAIVNLIVLINLAIFANEIVLIITFIAIGIVSTWAQNISQASKFQLALLSEDEFTKDEYLVATEFPLALGRILGLVTALFVVAILPEFLAYRLLIFLTSFFWIGNHIMIKKKTNWLKNV